MGDGNLVEKLGGLPSAVGIDSSVTDGIKDQVINSVASHIPGGDAIGNLLGGSTPAADATDAQS